MMRRRATKFWLWVATLTGGVCLLGDCDPTLQATVEDGIITTSTALFNAFLQSVIQISQEDTTTARLISDLVGPAFA